MIGPAIYPGNAVRVVVESLRPGAGGDAAATRRRATSDWRPVFAFANAHFVAPAMHAALAQANRLHELPSDAADYLALLHDGNARRNAAVKSQGIELIAALNEAGMVPMVLKGGAALFTAEYDDSGVRMVRDLDVLLQPEFIGQAIATLGELGYEAVTEFPAGYHACGDFIRPGSPAAIDLHQEVTNVGYVHSAAEMRRRAQVITLDGIRFLVPSPTDRMLHNILHAQIHYLGDYYRGRLELRQVFEFSMLVARYGREIDWNLVLERFSRHKLLTPLVSYALSACRLFGTPWPLPVTPSRTARFHCQRCLLQLHVPVLAPFVTPWANLRAAFASHRMYGLYGMRASLPVHQLLHAIRFLRKSTPRTMIERLMRAR